MNYTDKRAFIGFPTGLLGKQPLRLSVIDETKDWIAIDKPFGVSTRNHPWNKEMPDIDSALNKQLRAKKPELLEDGTTLFGSIYYMEPEISGLALFAKNQNSLAQLRNLAGSEKFQFKFIFVSKSETMDTKSKIIADAPLLIHNVKPKMIPSTAKGKKTETHFQRLQESAAGWTLWEARSSFFRPHQIRAHAFTYGIPVMGDELYSGKPMPRVSDFLPKKTPSSQHPLLDGVALHLSEITFPSIDAVSSERSKVYLSARLPKKFDLVLKKMKLPLNCLTPEFSGSNQAAIDE